MSGLKNRQIPAVLATQYASYRPEVIRSLTQQLDKIQAAMRRPLVLYDPMAGTAPLLPYVERIGCTAYFNDLNALHYYVNAAKTYRSYRLFTSVGSESLLSRLSTVATQLDRCRPIPTENWLDDNVLPKLALAWQNCGNERGPLATLIRALLLLSIRDFSSFTRTNNPTWLKPGGLRRDKRDKPALKVFGDAINRFQEYYDNAYAPENVCKGGRVYLTRNDATRLAPKQKVDVIMTSPPFCNRVDWDRLYAPEHFFLTAVGVWHTKKEFLGTTAVRGYSDYAADQSFVKKRSAYVTSFLKEVRERQVGSEQGSDYYVKYYTRYFAGLYRAFDLAASSLREKNSGIYFIVQDNAHRGLSIDIGRALAGDLRKRMFHATIIKRWEHHHLGMRNVSRHYRAVNPRQRETLWHASR